ncbi:hypothetical protein LP421_01495 (plasmid) [Rhizobium sp. RCAM05350]|nr:hypothetical protein LP421_01495 [Rhizobium sp. RCAM05350]
MASQYSIIIKNMSAQTMSFYAFQKQASFTNSGATPTVLSSSLASGALAPNASSGAQLNFGFDVQNYVGAKSAATSSSQVKFNASISMVSAKSAVSSAAAVQPIDLTTSAPSQTVDNSSVLTISPLGLSAATYQPGLTAGSFAIQVPSYTPTPVPQLYCGCAAINQDGSITLANFITPLTNSKVYCTPHATYYVAVGNISVGQSITYTTSQAEECDFTPGYTVITVQYHGDGSFTTKGS